VRLLLDTTVLIDALRLHRRRREWLAELVHAGHTLGTSAMNVAEIHAGMRLQEEASTELFLGALECYGVTRASGQLAGRLKRDWAGKGRALTLADTLVAAVALEHGCVLVTDNRKDFPMPELQLYPLPEN
jgi:hypothetical protein